MRPGDEGKITVGLFLPISTSRKISLKKAVYNVVTHDFFKSRGLYMIPESHKDLLEGQVYAVATTVMPDGQPQSTVVWVDYDGTYVRMNTAKGRQKARNIAQNPKVTIMLMDPQNPYHWLEIRGLVEQMTEEGGREHIETLSHKYTGQKYYGGFNTRTDPDKETRLLVKIKPVRVTSM